MQAKEGVGPTPVTSAALREVDLFEDMSAEQIDAVASLGQLRSISADDTLGGGDEQDPHLFVILRGEAQLSYHSRVGEIPVRVVGPGESYPVFILLGTGALIAVGQALTDMEVLALPSSRLRQMSLGSPEIGVRLYMAAAQVVASRYSVTLEHLAASAERQLGE